MVSLEGIYEEMRKISSLHCETCGDEIGLVFLPVPGKEDIY